MAPSWTDWQFVAVFRGHLDLESARSKKGRQAARSDSVACLLKLKSLGSEGGDSLPPSTPTEVDSRSAKMLGRPYGQYPHQAFAHRRAGVSGAPFSLDELSSCFLPAFGKEHFWSRQQFQNKCAARASPPGRVAEPPLPTGPRWWFPPVLISRSCLTSPERPSTQT